MSFEDIRRRLSDARRLATAKRQVARQLLGTPIGRLVKDVDRVAKTRQATKATADRLKRQLEQLTAGANREIVARTAVARQVAEIERYARGEGVWSWLGKRLGPVADTIRGLLQPGGERSEARDVAAAAELLNALGVSTDGAAGRRVSVDSRDPVAKADAERVLRSLGFDVTQREEIAPPPPPRQVRPTRLPPRDETRGMERRMLGGMFVYFEPGDPILTGEMIRVQSSNVHSSGFEWNDRQPETGTLKVRFLDSVNGKKTTSGGPTYHYYDVHPRVFMEFQRAASKGKFVWDRLRIRGTVSGHQYRYGLARLSKSGYVPRQATTIGDQEWYIQRTVQAADGRTLKSELRDRMVRQLTPDDLRRIAASPRSGRPNDGRPGGGRR